MRRLEEDTSLEQFWWTLSQVPWIQLELDHLDSYLGQITSCSDRPALEITGLKVTTQRVQNSSIPSLMLPGKRQRDVIAFKVFKLPTLWEVELDQVWELSLYPKLERNIQTESWKPSPWFLLQRFQTQSLSLIMPLFQFISWLKMQISAWSSITRHSTISVLELWSWQLLHMVIWITSFQQQCLESPAVSDFPVSLTQILEN